MLTPRRPEIDERTMKLVVGVVAITLAPLTAVFAKVTLASISASYYEGGPSETIFVGFLFAIASFLLAYNGKSRVEMILSKIAAAAGLCVALFPCACDSHDELVPYLHYIAAIVMFLVLTAFCDIFYRRAKAKRHMQANVRAGFYAACGAAIVLSMAALAFNALPSHPLEGRFPRVKFYGEAVGLIAFGISWLMASHVLPVVNREDERFSPLRENNPPQ